MLADQLFGVNSTVGDDSDTPLLKRKSSILKKTMMAFGKVKPTFNNNGNNNNNSKLRKSQMELIDSCASFDFKMDVTESDGDCRTPQKEDSKTDPESIPPEEDKGDMSVHSNKSSVILNRVTKNQNMVVINEELDVEREEKPKSSPSVFARALKLSTSNTGAQVDDASPSASDMTTWAGSKTTPSSRSKRKLVPRKKAPSDDASPLPKPASAEVPLQKILLSTPVASSKMSSASSPVATKKIPSAPSLSTPTARRRKPLPQESAMVTLALNPVMESGASTETLENQGAGVVASKKRLSRAFESGDAGGLDGYLNKLQEKNIADESNPEKGDGQQVLEEANNNGARAQNSARFKTPTRIKKLFGLHRSNPKEASQFMEKDDISSIEEAAMIVNELNNIIPSPIQREVPSKPNNFGELMQVDDVSVDALSLEYPEIPSEKKTSLGDIRNFAWRRETAREPKKKGTRRGARESSAGHDPKSGKEGRSTMHVETNGMCDRLGDTEEAQGSKRSEKRSGRQASRLTPLDQWDQARQVSEVAQNEGAPLDGEYIVGVDPVGHHGSSEENLQLEHASRRHPREAKLYDKPNSRLDVSEQRLVETSMSVKVDSAPNTPQRSRRSRSNKRHVGSDKITKQSSRTSLRESYPLGNDQDAEGTPRRKHRDRRMETSESNGSGTTHQSDHKDSQLDHSILTELGEDNATQEIGKPANPVDKESLHGSRRKRITKGVDANSEAPSSTRVLARTGENTKNIASEELTEAGKQRESGDTEFEKTHPSDNQLPNHSSRRRKTDRKVSGPSSCRELMHEPSTDNQCKASSLDVEYSSLSGETPQSNSICNGANTHPSKLLSKSQSRRGTRRSGEKVAVSNKPRSQRKLHHTDHIKRHACPLNHDQEEDGCADEISGISKIREVGALQARSLSVVKTTSEDQPNSTTTTRHRSRSSHRRQTGSGSDVNSFGAAPAPGPELSRSLSMSHIGKLLEQKHSGNNTKIYRRGTRCMTRGYSEKHCQGLTESQTQQTLSLTVNQVDDKVVPVVDGESNDPAADASATEDSKRIDVVTEVVDDKQEGGLDWDRPPRSQSVSLNDTLERGSLVNCRLFEDDGQQTVITEDSCQWYNQGSDAYSNIKSSTSVSAAQLVFGTNSNTAKKKSLGVKNV